MIALVAISWTLPVFSKPSQFYVSLYILGILYIYLALPLGNRVPVFSMFYADCADLKAVHQRTTPTIR